MNLLSGGSVWKLAKLLKHRKTGAVRFLLRQEKTMKIVGNHVVVDKAPYCAIKPLDQSAKFRCWTAQDYADDEPTVETLALKFGSIELADKFEEAFTLAKQGKLTTPVTSEGTSAKKDEASTSAKPVEKSPEKKPEAPAKADAVAALGGGLFSTPASSGGGLFGGAPASSGSGIFGGAPAGSGGGIFGGAPASSGGGIFGGAPASSGGGIFGGVKLTPAPGRSEPEPEHQQNYEGYSYGEEYAEEDWE